MREPSPSLLSPDQVDALPRIGLRARHTVEGFLSGLHRGKRFGWNMEFAGHRDYAPGDDLRTLDWKAYGRTDRYFIKQYEEETSLRVTLLLDTSGSMGYGSGDIRKLDYAAQLAAALAYLVVRQKDQIGLGWFSEALGGFMPPRTSLPHLRQLWTALETLEAGGEVDYATHLRGVASRLPRRGVLVLITDTLASLGDLERGLRYFIGKKFDLILIQLLDPAELEFPFRGDRRFLDGESTRHLDVDSLAVRDDYLAALSEHQERIRQMAFGLHADLHLCDTAQSVEQTLFALLSRRRQLRR